MIQTFTQNTIALVYDFDETLSPKPMQEYTILPELGENPVRFWEECNAEAEKLGADSMLTYMRLLIDKMISSKKGLNKNDLKNLASAIEYFDGVEGWFDSINYYIKEKFGNAVLVEHYIISAGLEEILNGITIKHHFKKIFASKYYFDEYGRAVFPTVVVNAAVKTQYLFQINKGTDKINDHMREENRAIPFTNMLYIGDGDTDVPCMAIVKNNGGYAMAVYKPKSSIKIATCKKLLNANRIDYYAAANYNECSDLDKRVKLIIDAIGANILLEKEKFKVKQKIK